MNDFENQLLRYLATSSGEQRVQAQRCIDFLRGDPDCFERSNPHGHFTGSALVADWSRNKTLLVLHKKYRKWVMTGGHCDGIRDPAFTAYQEAYQESGLKRLTPFRHGHIIDINIEIVPEYNGVPEHLHYDIRFLFLASSEDEVEASDESDGIAWPDLDGLSEYSEEPQLHRLLAAAMALRPAT
jgi:hypothetical protein